VRLSISRSFVLHPLHIATRCHQLRVVAAPYSRVHHCRSDFHRELGWSKNQTTFFLFFISFCLYFFFSFFFSFLLICINFFFYFDLMNINSRLFAYYIKKKFDNKTSFIAFNRTISLAFDFVNPFVTNDILVKARWNKNPNAIFCKSI
jgi:ABC-type iron transport system FetAB permease component